MPNYWFVSIPAEGDKHAAWHGLRRSLGVTDSASDLAQVNTFTLPDFKIGTLDALVLVSDDLHRQDQVAEAAVLKLVEGLRSLTLHPEDLPHLLTVKDKSIADYVQNFQWSAAKYRADRPVREIADRISEEITNIDTATRAKLSSWSQTKSAVIALQRKQGGNLSVRDLANVVKKDDCVIGSDYLRTVFVAVPKNLTKEFLRSYETMTPMVVPRSAANVAEDNDYVLYGVTIFSRALADFTAKCRDERFTVRDFLWDEHRAESDRAALAESTSAQDVMQIQLTEWVKASFADAFAAWVHLKALRVYVESLLRYGLPADFVVASIAPRPKAEDKVLAKLDKEYASIGRQFAPVKETGTEDASAALALLEDEYKPYVWFEVRWALTDPRH